MASPHNKKKGALLMLEEAKIIERSSSTCIHYVFIVVDVVVCKRPNKTLTAVALLYPKESKVKQSIRTHHSSSKPDLRVNKT